MYKIVITGGPCSGKTKVLNYLVESLETNGYKTIVVSETATELIKAGCIPNKNITPYDFQNLLLKNQIRKEDLCIETLNKDILNKTVILFDRGVLDNFAYLQDKEEYLSMLKENNLNLSDCYKRYDEAIFLHSTANGKESSYKWNNPITGEIAKNEARFESPEEAKLLNEKTLNGYIGIENLKVFGAYETFEEKKNSIVDHVLNTSLSTLNLNQKRKFLIKKPSKIDLSNLGYTSSFKIYQSIVGKQNNIDDMIIAKGNEIDGINYYRIKINKENNSIIDTINLSKYEYEKISLSAYDLIYKDRNYFVHDSIYYKIDIYPNNEEYAILEVETTDINDEILLPNGSIEIVKEFKNSAKYNDKVLVRTLSER